MPILPIDLQTMFSQMNRVGKEQAVQKQVAPEAQAFQAKEIVKDTEAKDTSVNESQEVGQGVEGVKADEERKKRRGSGAKSNSESDAEETGAQNELFKDPDLGKHIDSSG